MNRETVYACNCMYGTNDPRCCVAKALRAQLEEAHRLGREGKPLPSKEIPERSEGWMINHGQAKREPGSD